MKPLLVGEAPGPNGDPEKPLDGRPAMRLAKCMGWAEDVNFDSKTAAARLRDLFEVRNLLERPMQRLEGTKGTEWPEEEAADAARRLALLLERKQPLVCLGKRVSKAFGFGFDYWHWWPDDLGGPVSGPAVVVPHPSGIVRLWNDPVTGVRTGYTLWQALGKAPR